MAETGTLHDAFIDELKDTYDAERQLTKALAKLAKAASAPSLREACETHLEETEAQIERLERVFESLDEKARGKHCEGIAGIIEEGKSIMEEDFDETTMDACLIAAGQRAEHYEMAAYGTLVAWARAMGHTEAADLLQAGAPTVLLQRAAAGAGRQVGLVAQRDVQRAQRGLRGQRREQQRPGGQAGTRAVRSGLDQGVQVLEDVQVVG